MSSFSRQRKRRLRHFERRWAVEHAGGDNCYSHCGCRYLATHPLCDEAGLLERLGLKPEDCRYVHAWCQFGTDAFQLMSEAVGETRHQTIAISSETQDGLTICTRLPVHQISRGDLETAIELVIRHGIPGRKFFRTHSRHRKTLFRWPH